MSQSDLIEQALQQLSVLKEGRIITVGNNKGGTRKTTTSLAVGLEFIQSYFVTNDLDSPIKQIIPKERLRMLDLHERVPGVKRVDEDGNPMNVIYDMGGHRDPRAIVAAKVSDVVLVPTTPNPMDLQVSLQAINSFRQVNENVIVVVTREDRDQKRYDKFESTVLRFFPDIKIMPLRKSAAFLTMVDSRCSLSEVIANAPWYARHYKKSLLEVINIYAAIQEMAS